MTDDYTEYLEKRVAKLERQIDNLEAQLRGRNAELLHFYDNMDIHRRIELYTTVLAQVQSETNDWRIPWIVAWRHGMDPLQPNGEHPVLSNPEIADRFRECDIGASRVAQLYGQGMAILRDNPRLREWVVENYPERFRTLKRDS